MDSLNAWIAQLSNTALAVLVAAPIFLGIAWAFVRRSASLLLVGIILNRVAMLVLLWKTTLVGIHTTQEHDLILIVLLLMAGSMGWMFNLLSMAVNHDARGGGFTRIRGPRERRSQDEPRTASRNSDVSKQRGNTDD